MKKILSLLFIFIIICGCTEVGKENIDPNQRYYSLIDSINEHDSFSNFSNYYNISTDIAKINDGYRFYITIDEPTCALYDIEALAIEKNVDYSSNMAASIGIFDEREYSMIPNQKNVDKGFVSGLVFSGVSQSPETSLYIYVSFKNSDYSNVYNEYIKLDVKYEGE